MDFLSSEQLQRLMLEHCIYYMLVTLKTLLARCRIARYVSVTHSWFTYDDVDHTQKCKNLRKRTYINKIIYYSPRYSNFARQFNQ